jgi:uncharacterized membrane protein
MQTPPEHLTILKNAGVVLLIAGMIDIMFMIYSIAKQIPYSSSLNIFAVVGGIFLLKGNLRAASIIRWGAAFALSALLATLVIAPLILPINLTFTAIKLNPGPLVWSFVVSLFFMGLLWWLFMQLSKSPVLAARAAAGRKVRNMYIPVILGAALAVSVGIASMLMQRSDSAIKAVDLVQQRLGTDYRYHVASLKYKSSSEGSFVSGVVTAWNSGEIIDIPFQWQE